VRDLRWREIRRPASSRSQRGIMHHRAAAVHRAEHAVHHAGDVEHRHHAQAHALGAAVAPQRRRPALASACGACACSPWAGRWCPRCRAAAPGRRGRRRVRPGGACRLPGHRPAHRARRAAAGRCAARPGWAADGARRVERAFGHRVGIARDDDVRRRWPSRQAAVGLVHDGRQVGAGDGQAGLRVGDVVAELVGAVHRVHRHHHRVGAQHGVEATAYCGQFCRNSSTRSPRCTPCACSQPASASACACSAQSSARGRRSR
jgi:hypothetical protein